MESGSQPTFPPQPSPSLPLPLGGEARTSLVPSSNPTYSPIPSQPDLQGPKAHRPPPAKAPRTSAWSLDMMINPGK